MTQGGAFGDGTGSCVCRASWVFSLKGDWGHLWVRPQLLPAAPAGAVQRVRLPSCPQVMVSNPHSLGLQAVIYEDGHTYDGNTKHRLVSSPLPLPTPKLGSTGEGLGLDRLGQVQPPHGVPHWTSFLLPFLTHTQIRCCGILRGHRPCPSPTPGRPQSPRE